MEDKDQSFYPFIIGEFIDRRYWVHSEIGRGSFGSVGRCVDIVNDMEVAVKIFKKGYSFTKCGIYEAEILQKIKQYNRNHYKIISCLATFSYKTHFCIVTPLYYHNLYYSIITNKGKGLPLSIVKKIATQLLECLYFLQNSNIHLIHTDIKPENVVRVNIRVWDIILIDFGSAISYPPMDDNYHIQTIFYRSPEVILELPFGYPIDMWSLGCLLFEISTGVLLFEECHEIKIMALIIEVLGLPPIRMIRDSLKSSYWFDLSNQPPTVKILQSKKSFPPGTRTLERLFASYVNMENEKKNEYKELIDLIKNMLQYDPLRRITPIEGLRHHFINSSKVYQYHLEVENKSIDSELISKAIIARSESNLNEDFGPFNPNVEEIDDCHGQVCNNGKLASKTISCTTLSTFVNTENINRKSNVLETVEE